MLKLLLTANKGLSFTIYTKRLWKFMVTVFSLHSPFLVVNKSEFYLLVVYITRKRKLLPGRKQDLFLVVCIVF